MVLKIFPKAVGYGHLRCYFFLLLLAALGITQCTACNKQINTNNTGAAKRHPVLKVLICKVCYAEKYSTTISIEIFNFPYKDASIRLYKLPYIHQNLLSEKK